MISAYCTGQEQWPSFRGNPENTGFFSGTFAGNPSLVWELNLKSKMLASPIVANNTVFVASTEGVVQCISAEGKTVWERDLSSGFEASPLWNNGKLYLGSLEGDLFCLDANTGKSVWTDSIGSQLSGAANFYNQGGQTIILVGCYDNNMYAISSDDGKIKYKIETGNYINGTAAIGNNYAYFGGCDALIHALDLKSNTEKFKVDLQVYLAASPAVKNDMVYVGNYDGSFFCVDANQQKIRWKFVQEDSRGGIIASPAVDDENVYIGNQLNQMFCFNRFNGKLLWKFVASGNLDSSPVVSATQLLFGSGDGFVRILDKKTGLLTWEYNCGAKISTSCAPFFNGFVVLTNDGMLMYFK